MRIGELLDGHFKVLKNDVFVHSHELQLEPSMVAMSMAQALQRAMADGSVRAGAQSSLKFEANSENVVFYQLDLSRCHVALLRDLPETGDCPKNVPSASEDAKFWVCVQLLASTNRIRRMANLCPPLEHLLYLDLSVNHLTRIEGLERVSSLTHLSLHHNSLETADGLDGCMSLKYLDVSFNQIEVLAASLGPLGNLVELRVSGNKLKALSGLSHLKSIKKLEAYANQIVDPRGVVWVANTLMELNLADNLIDNLGDTRTAVLALTNLRELSFQGNPICSVPNYRMELMAPKLHTLDTQRITPQLRDHVRRQRVEEDLDKLSKATSEQFLSMIDQEDMRKARGVTALKERESEMQEAFLRYRAQMQSEMQECLQYVESLKTRTDVTWKVSDSTLTNWKGMLQSAELARRSVALETKDEDLTAEELMRRIHSKLLANIRGGHVETIEGRMDLRDELVSLSRNNPERWREIKLLELGLRARAESSLEKSRDRDARRGSLTGRMSDAKEEDPALVRARFAKEYSRLAATYETDASPRVGAGAGSAEAKGDDGHDSEEDSYWAARSGRG